MSRVQLITFLKIFYHITFPLIHRTNRGKKNVLYSFPCCFFSNSWTNPRHIPAVKLKNHMKWTHWNLFQFYLVFICPHFEMGHAAFVPIEKKLWFKKTLQKGSWSRCYQTSLFSFSRMFEKMPIGVAYHQNFSTSDCVWKWIRIKLSEL